METHDSILRGALRISQARRGYRFNVDSVLLARWAGRDAPGPPAAPRRALDLGCGSGVIGLILLHDRVADALVGVDVQPGMVARCRANAAANGLAERVGVFEADVRRLLEPAWRERLGPCGLVVANPPYRTAHQGPTPPDRERAIGRGGAGEGLADWAAAMVALAAPGARLCCVYPAADQARLVAAFATAGAQPRRLCAVHPRPGRPATRVLLECQVVAPGPTGPPARAGCLVEPPLTVHEADGYSARVAAMLAP